MIIISHINKDFRTLIFYFWSLLVTFGLLVYDTIYIYLHQKYTFGLVIHKTKSIQKLPKVKYSGSKPFRWNIVNIITFGDEKYFVVLLAIAGTIPTTLWTEPETAIKGQLSLPNAKEETAPRLLQICPSTKNLPKNKSTAYFVKNGKAPHLLAK